MPPVISNTSPLIKLAGVGHLELLGDLFGMIWIPALVAEEFLAGATPADPDIRSLPWLHIQAVTADPTISGQAQLGAGEAAALSMALQYQARLTILDDLAARRVAQQRGLPVIGTLGVLLEARRSNLIPAVRPLVDAMIAQGRRISPTLRAEILRAAGEAG